MFDAAFTWCGIIFHLRFARSVKWQQKFKQCQRFSAECQRVGYVNGGIRLWNEFKYSVDTSNIGH